MSFCSFSKDTITSGKTQVDNLFITNYLPEAPQQAVKVYLYGLYLCNSDFNCSLSDMATSLLLSIEEIKDYFKYWEEYGLVSIISTEPFNVTYYSLTNNFNKYKRIKPEKYSDFSKALQTIITERMISVNEYSEYFQLMESSSLKQEALLMICKYCSDLKGANITYKYILAVARDFINRGITTEDLVEKELSKYTLSTKEVGEIFRALKLTRQPDVEDIQLYKKWTEKYGFEHEFLLEVIKISKSKTIKKLDKAVDEMFSNKCYSTESAVEFFENKDKLYKLSQDINRALGIYVEVLDNEVLSYVSPWVAMGYNEEALLFIANYCFRKNKRSLEQMSDTVKKLQKLGLISLDNITDYLIKRANNDKFISKIISIVGANRKVTEWDRENLQLWREWNFTDEIILEAAKRSVGIKNHVSYMTKILTEWKSKNVYTLDGINTLSNKQFGATNSAKPFGNERTYTKEELDELIDNSFDDIGD